jgi:hypothetical protein
MHPSTKSHTPLSSHLSGRSAARAVMRLLSACADSIRTLVAYPRDDADPDRPERPHVATLGALGEFGWHVAEIRPSNDAPVLWRVEIKRYDGAVSIVVIDATDPDAALEELTRYAVADAEDPS